MIGMFGQLPYREDEALGTALVRIAVMMQPSLSHAPLSTKRMVQPMAQRFYEDTLAILLDANIPFLVGGALALKHFAGIARDTKDLDVFLKKEDLERAMTVLQANGYETDILYPHWLAKAISGKHFVDFIIGSANGLCPVDDGWFKNAAHCKLWGLPVLVSPAEEMLVSKCFVMERERFDGADVYHLIEAYGDRLDWDRVVTRFGENWRVLLAHLVFFEFVYPQKREKIPRRILSALLDRAKNEQDSEPVNVCRGTLLSREQYLVDLRERGYSDARLPPWGDADPNEIELWTDAIGKEE